MPTVQQGLMADTTTLGGGPQPSHLCMQSGLSPGVCWAGDQKTDSGAVAHSMSQALVGTADVTVDKVNWFLISGSLKENK